MQGEAGTSKRAFGPLQWLMVVAIVLAAVFTVYKIFRLTGLIRDWDRREAVVVKPWMRPARVARIHRVSLDVVNEAVGLPPDARDGRSLAEIAASQGRSFPELRDALENKLIEHKTLGPAEPEGSP